MVDDDCDLATMQPGGILSMPDIRVGGASSHGGTEALAGRGVDYA